MANMASSGWNFGISDFLYNRAAPQKFKDAEEKFAYFYNEYIRADHDASEPLKNALSQIILILENREQSGRFSNDEGEIDTLIGNLHVIATSTKPEEIFPSVDEEGRARIQQECRELIEILGEMISPSMDNPEESAMIAKFQQVFLSLEAEKHKQQGPLAKGWDFITRRIAAEYRNRIGQADHATKAKQNAAIQHPLMRLLNLLGAEKGTHYPRERQVELSNALFDLSNSGEFFAQVAEGVDVSTQTNIEVFNHVSTFIHRKVHAEHVALRGHLVALSAQAEEVYQVSLFDLAFPDRSATLRETKIAVGRRILASQAQVDIGEDHNVDVPPSTALTAAIAQEHHPLAKMVTAARATYRLDTILLETNEDRKSAEALWMAIAHHEETQKCTALRGQFLEDRTTQNLPTQFDLLISFLERQPQLLPDGGGALMGELTEMIVQWTDLARVAMLQERGADQVEINRQFELVMQQTRKGNHLEAIRMAQRLVEGSPLGLRMWDGEEAASAGSFLGNALHDINSVVPPRAPPKSSGEVRKKLGVGENEEIDWDKAWNKVIDTERQNLVTNTCDVTAFNISMTYVVGRSSDERKDLYDKLVSAIDDVAGESGNFDGGDLEDRVRRALSSIGGSTSDESIEKIMIALDEVKGADYDNDRKRKELHETLYFSLLWEHLDQSEDLNFLTKLAGHSILVVVHKLLQFFIRPFTESLLNMLRRDIILPSNGALTETHLSPIRTIGNALDSFSDAKKAWAGLKEKQARGEIHVHPERSLLGKDEIEGVGIVLDDPIYYHGYDPKEVDLEFGYRAVDELLEVAHFCERTKSWHETISHNANRPLIEEPDGNFQEWVNTIGVAIKKVISIIPHLFVYAIHLCLKVLEMLFNFLAKQLAKWAIWNWDIVTVLLDQMTNSLFKSTTHAPVVDELLLDQLKELEEHIRHDSQEERAGMLGHESPLVKRQMQEAFAKLFEAIEIDSKDTAQEVNDSGTNPLTKWGKIQLKSNLKELLSSLLIVSSQSFLNREQMNEVLLKTLTSANEGLRGQTAALKPDEMQKLREDLGGREPTTQEIEQRSRQNQAKLQSEIQEKLNTILENGVNPAIQRTIEGTLKGPSDHLLEYVGWMERRLFSSPGQELATENNILQTLRSDLQNLRDNREEKHLRDVHGHFSSFIQEYVAKQANLDRSRIPNGLKLNRLFHHNLAEDRNPENERSLKKHFKDLTDQMVALVRTPEEAQIAAMELTLNQLETTLKEQREEISKIKRAEQSRVEGMHQGFTGVVRRVIEEVKDEAQREITPIAQKALNYQIRRLSSQSQGLAQNPVIIRHVTRNLMLSFVEARA